jgi:hypothetical protein
MRIGKGSASDPNSSGAVLGEDSAVSHKSMNRKGYFRLDRNGALFDREASAIELSVALQ